MGKRWCNSLRRVSSQSVVAASQGPATAISDNNTSQASATDHPPPPTRTLLFLAEVITISNTWEHNNSFQLHQTRLGTRLRRWLCDGERIALRIEK